MFLIASSGLLLSNCLSPVFFLYLSQANTFKGQSDSIGEFTNNSHQKHFPTFNFSEHVNTSRPNPGQGEKIKLDFYFHTSLWFLKRFCEGLHKCTGREGLKFFYSSPYHSQYINIPEHVNHMVKMTLYFPDLFCVCFQNLPFVS